MIKFVVFLVLIFRYTVPLATAILAAVAIMVACSRFTDFLSKRFVKTH